MKFQKIIDDTLKERDGKYSRKSLTMFVSLLVAIAITFIIVIKYESSADVSLYAWLAMATGQSILSLNDKKHQRNINKNENEIIG